MLPETSMYCLQANASEMQLRKRGRVEVESIYLRLKSDSVSAEHHYALNEGDYFPKSACHDCKKNRNQTGGGLAHYKILHAKTTEHIAIMPQSVFFDETSAFSA